MQLTAEDVKDIVRSKIIDHQQLKAVDLYTLIGGKGCKYLSQANWPKLQILNLVGNQIGDQGCKHLGQAVWPNLEILIIQRNKIGDKGSKHLSKANWPNLQILNLDNNQIGAQGCKHLRQANRPNLRKFSLYYNQIGDEGCKFLLTFKQNLRWLFFTSNNLINKDYWMKYIQSVQIRNKKNKLIQIKF